MKIGMSLTSSYDVSRDSKVIMENLVEEVKLMAELGFDSFSLGDHHLTDSHYMQVLPAISSLAQMSGDMRLLPLFLLPFYNPILLAEQLATLDVITGGRTTIINALGSGPAAFTAFGTSQRARVSRFVETFEIMQALWAGDGVTYQGRHYKIDAPVSLNPKPVSQPLPMWIAGSAEPAIQRAAKMGDGWVVVPGWTPDLVKQGIKVYRDSLTEFGRDERDMDIVLRRDTHLAPTSVAGHREAQTLFENGYRGLGAREMEESLIVGGPGECIEYLEEMERAGVTHVLFRCALDEGDQALQTIRVLGDDVIPHFQR
ncbi:MAG: hypothetical protein BZY88_03695 [SAR202 cluster bacterium Io17-Chloro-G9]|nr:MAG: hypothetical protein BZY88_03695 [SAR202 cluster bacterium Io17-Chloro-G9]